MEIDKDSEKLNSGSSSSGGAFTTSSSIPMLSSLIEKEPGLKIGCEDGFYGPGKAHLLTYDESKMRQ
jgi:hypothetical protein